MLRRAPLGRKTALKRKTPMRWRPKAKPSADKGHLERVKALGCIICGDRAEAHHILEGRFSQRRVSDLETIPLCRPHHTTGGYGVAIHAGPVAWRERYGSERAMLAKVMERLEAAK